MDSSDNDYFPCASCGALTHIDDLDGKPQERRACWPLSRLYALYRWAWLFCSDRPTSAFDDPEGSTDWTRLECGACYGPGYLSNRDNAQSGGAQW